MELENLDKHNIIFAYILKNAFGQELRKVYVTNDKVDNLHLIKDSSDKIISTINIEEIKNVLLKYKEDFDNLKRISLTPPKVLDGYINEVFFKINDSWHNDRIDNLYYYDGKDLDNNKHLSEVIGLLDDIYDVLYSQDKQIKEYFVLYDPDDEEEDDN